MDFLFSHNILICSFTSVSYFRECELYLGIPDTHIRYFPCQNHHLGDIIMFFCTCFYLLVKEMSEWIYIPSRAARVGWTSHTHSLLTDAARHRHCKTAYLSPSIFAYNIPCKKYHALEGSRARWDITIPDFSPTLPLLHKASSKPLHLTWFLLWFIRGVFQCGQVLQHPALTSVCRSVPSLFLGASVLMWVTKRGHSAELGVTLTVHRERTGHMWATVSLSCRCKDKL